MKKHQRLYNAYGNRCSHCGTTNKWFGILDSYAESYLTPDHIVPKSLGGNNNSMNLQPLCWKCNSVKGSDISRIEEDQEKRMNIYLLTGV